MELKEQRMHFFKVFSVFSIKWEGEGRGAKGAGREAGGVWTFGALKLSC